MTINKFLRSFRIKNKENERVNFVLNKQLCDDFAKPARLVAVDAWKNKTSDLQEVIFRGEPKDDRNATDGTRDHNLPPPCGVFQNPAGGYKSGGSDTLDVRRKRVLRMNKILNEQYLGFLLFAQEETLNITQLQGIKFHSSCDNEIKYPSSKIPCYLISCI